MNKEKIVGGVTFPVLRVTNLVKTGGLIPHLDSVVPHPAVIIIRFYVGD